MIYLIWIQMPKAGQKNYHFKMFISLQEQLTTSGLYLYCSRPSPEHYSNLPTTTKMWCTGMCGASKNELYPVLVDCFLTYLSVLVFYCRIFNFAVFRQYLLQVQSDSRWSRHSKSPCCKSAGRRAERPSEMCWLLRAPWTDTHQKAHSENLFFQRFWVQMS